MDANESRSFLYDGVNRLTSADGPWGNVAYTYDARNNLRTKTFRDGRFVQMFVNSQNRVFRYNDTLTTGGVNRNLGYDDRGNVRNNSRQVFEYDLANQPLTTRNQGVTSTFVYDGNYKRVKQTINGETIYTVYGLDGSIKLRDNITTGEVTDYVRLGGKTIAELQNGVPTYLYPDHLGTPVAGADQQRNILWRDSRTPFGEKINPVAARENRVGYTGHIEDDALKLTYMQARYYDPVIGRFMSNDPVGFASGGVGYFNRYAYTANNPINFVDPDGKEWDRNNRWGNQSPADDNFILQAARSRSYVVTTTNEDGSATDQRYAVTGGFGVADTGTVSETGTVTRLPQRSANGAPATVADKMLKALLNFSAKENAEVQVTSGLRTQQQNEDINGATNSPHLETNRSLAADIAIAGRTPAQTADAAYASGEFVRVNHYDPTLSTYRSGRGTHVDFGPPTPNGLGPGRYVNWN